MLGNSINFYIILTLLFNHKETLGPILSQLYQNCLNRCLVKSLKSHISKSFVINIIMLAKILFFANFAIIRLDR